MRRARWFGVNTEIVQYLSNQYGYKSVNHTNISSVSNTTLLHGCAYSKTQVYKKVLSQGSATDVKELEYWQQKHSKLCIFQAHGFYGQGRISLTALSKFPLGQWLVLLYLFFIIFFSCCNFYITFHMNAPKLKNFN